MRKRTASRRMRRPVLAGALLCALCLPSLAEDAIPAQGDAEIDLGALTFPVEGVRQVTYVVARIAATFASAADADRHGDSGSIIRLRDAAHGAVRDTRPGEVAGQVDVAAIERRLHRAMSGRATGLEGVRFDVLAVRTADRR